MAKLTLNDISTSYASKQALNTNFGLIEDALENTLSLDGTSPNALEADLDLNNHRILNLPAPVSATEPVRKGEFDALTAGVATGDTSILSSISVYAWAAGSGTNTITATFDPPLTSLASGLTIGVKAAAANSSTTPTFNPNSLGALTIKKAGSQALAASDIPRAGYEMVLRYQAGSPGHWELLNPNTAVPSINIANNRVLGNNTGSTADATALTATQVLAMLGDTQGQILIRDGSAWTILSPGTSGQFLKTQGAAANPVWADATVSGATLILDSGSCSTGSTIVKSFDLSGYGTTYRRFQILIHGALPASADSLILETSVDGGSTWKVTNYSYSRAILSSVYSGTSLTSQTSIGLMSASADAKHVTIDLENIGISDYVGVSWKLTLANSGAATYPVIGNGTHSTVLCTAVRIRNSSVNNTAGKYTLIGIT